jgi:hypothetical protein
MHPSAIETHNTVIRLLAVTPDKEDHSTLDLMLPYPKWAGKRRHGERVTWVHSGSERHTSIRSCQRYRARYSGTSLDRLSQLNLALFFAAMNRRISLDEQVLGLSSPSHESRRVLRRSFYTFLDISGILLGSS